MNEHAPGWYEHAGERRYWDGSRWTHSTSMPSAPVAPPPGEVVAPYIPPAQGYGAPAPGYGPPPGGPYGAPYPGGPPPARKEPGIALLVSFFIPGVGSMINGDVGAGVGFLGAYGFGLVLIVCLGWLLIGLIGLPLCIGAWIWSMVHAYQGAVGRNRALGYPG